MEPRISVGPPAPLESSSQRDQNSEMTSEDTKWQRVEQEWERVMRGFRKKAIQGLANDGILSDQDVEFHRIVLRLTDEQQN
jgi:hypothetical protein